MLFIGSNVHDLFAGGPITVVTGLLSLRSDFCQADFNGASCNSRSVVIIMYLNLEAGPKVQPGIPCATLICSGYKTRKPHGAVTPHANLWLVFVDTRDDVSPDCRVIFSRCRRRRCSQSVYGINQQRGRQTRGDPSSSQGGEYGLQSFPVWP